MTTASPTLNRRGFLQIAGGVTACVVLTGSAGGCAGVRRGEFSSVDPLDALPRLIPPGASILQWAALAPSSHNTQPWQLQIVDEATWRITLDPARHLPQVDPDGRESVVSLGAFLENLDRAAGASGYLAQMNVAGADATDLTVEIRLSDCSPSGNDLSPLKRRRTVKSGLDGRALAPDDLAELLDAWPGHIEFIPRESTTGAAIAELTVASMREQMSREAARIEFANWVRLKRDDAERRRDGLTTEGMEITGFAGWWVRTFMDNNDLISESFGDKSVDKTADQSGEGAGWLLVRADGESPSDWLEAGRGFQRLGLTAATRSIGLHPMSQILEEPTGRAGLQECIGPDHHVQMLVRAGYKDSYPDPVSLRRPISWFVRS